MRFKSCSPTIFILTIAFLLLLNNLNGFGQNRGDSLYRPQIQVTSLNGFGPYIIGSKRSNMFILYQLPKKTTAIILKMIDSKGIQIKNPYVLTGTNLQTATWSFESDTMKFPLSPQFCAEIHYQTDSVAVYKIPYTVYPDTVTFLANKGFGPFITNNYQISDTAFHPVPSNLNSFTAKNLPPRTDTVIFQIITGDSAVIQSSMVTAAPGTHLDSAMYDHVRMDLLPLNTAYLKALIFCEGGPKEGLQFHKPLVIMPHKPKLICSGDSLLLHDSIGVFVQNQISGQTLAVDSIKHAVIRNGPGQRDLDNSLRTIYPGPYSLDIIENSFATEAWMKFNLTGITSDMKIMTLMRVDSVWQLYAETNSAGTRFAFASLTDLNAGDLWSVNISNNLLTSNEGWHHLAFSCYNDNSGNYPSGHFYLDGVQLPGTHFDDSNYDYITTYLDWNKLRGTQPLFLGGIDISLNSLVTAMDEVRIWSRPLTAEEISWHYRKPPLQEYSLEGYWNFDDLRNRLNYISDKSYNNNFGALVNKATFVPQFPGIQRTTDTLRILSSNLHTDSVRYLFSDRNNIVIDSVTKPATGGKSLLVYDMASLPCFAGKLDVVEYYRPASEMAPVTSFPFTALAPQPIATPQFNWNTYYTTPVTTGKSYAPVTISGFPDNTSRVKIGLRKGNQVFDTASYTTGSIPYHHSLALNGSDNWIQTSKNITSPSSFSILFWVKTTTGHGGKIIGFSDNQNGNSTSRHDREVFMAADGSLQFNMLSGSVTKTIYGLSGINDGNWHHVAVTVDNNLRAAIYTDGCLVDDLTLSNLQTYQGWWIIGTTGVSEGTEGKSPAPFFNGSLAEVSIWNQALSSQQIKSLRFQPGVNPGMVLYYPLNEGTGTAVTDHAGADNGTVVGSAPNWTISNTISWLNWNSIPSALQPGTYTMFANVSYPDAPPSGASYDLGNFTVDEPFPGYSFTFFLSEGQGYFNQGMALNNILSFSSDFTGNGQPGYTSNYIKYCFLSPDHHIIGKDSVSYTTIPFSGQFNIDMGDAPVGSYISLETGYYRSGGVEVFQNSVSIPIYIHPMLPPKVNGNFGPFDQAIAPGTMQRLNTFTIITEPLTDLDSLVILFHDADNLLIARCPVTKVSDTLWSATYDMSILSPPVTNMILAYYLGHNPLPAGTEGPYPITIHKTRPGWFDFLPPDNFSNIQQTGNTVTFTVTSPFEKSFMQNGLFRMLLPVSLPLISGLITDLEAPGASAHLKYDVAAHKLELNQAPEYFQKYASLGLNTDPIALSFNMGQNNTYAIDNNNNLIATQNFTAGVGATKAILEIENIAKKVTELLNYSSVVDPESIIVKPTFNITVNLGLQYSSRLNMKVDSLTGKWGSCGSLDIDADSTHHEAYRNSASYHFLSGAFGIEFSIGASFLEGLVSGSFGLDSRIVFGGGKSYVSIPASASKSFKTGAFQVYGRFYEDFLWGWYETDIWGPNLFYSANFWNDDMSSCFPPMNKKAPDFQPIVAKSTNPGLGDEIIPVNGFSKMQQPVPSQALGSSAENKAVSWVEPGQNYGERSLRLSYLMSSSKKFSENISIEINDHVLNSPAAAALSDNQVLLSWARTRHTTESIQVTSPGGMLPEVLKAQDIYYAVYDIPAKKVKQLSMIEDDTLLMNSGRTEGNPKLVILSDARALIVWQVADLDANTSSLWYVILSKQENKWISSEPANFLSIPGVKSQVALTATSQGGAALVWLNATGENHQDKKLMTSLFDGNNWTAPEELISFTDNQSCNYFYLKCENGYGGVALTVYNENPGVTDHEKLIFIPFNVEQHIWQKDQAVDLYREHVAHLQLPRIAINKNGKVAIALKVERIGKKETYEKISQLDLFCGDLNSPSGKWSHIPANQFVCDTTKQVSEVAFSYIDNDTLMLLSYEYPMGATNSAYTPSNGVIFGNPVMNIVLRCFDIHQDSIVADVPEQIFFVGLEEPGDQQAQQKLINCFPNPCSDFTMITFDVAERADTRLEVFDLSGNQVATLVDQDLPPGRYQMKMNTSLLGPGVYLCRFTNGTRRDQLKFVVTR
jgi:hypothetical protein